MATKDFTWIVQDGVNMNVGAWASAVASDTGAPVEMRGQMGVAGSIQISGTIGTTTIQVSNEDPANNHWVTLPDAATDFALDTAGIYEFSTTARWMRPSFGSGASGCVVTVVFRG